MKQFVLAVAVVLGLTTAASADPNEEFCRLLAEGAGAIIDLRLAGLRQTPVETLLLTGLDRADPTYFITKELIRGVYASPIENISEKLSYISVLHSMCLIQAEE